jgi:phosphotransferase system HPr-like phosphotransfer protein
VFDYRLDDRAIGVRSPAEAKDFSSSLSVQTGSEAHPASCSMGIRVLSLGLKRGRDVTLTSI